MGSAVSQKIKVFFVASTHWDREWYEPFQGYRYRLVRMLDEVLDVMAADPKFAIFQTDGQSIILEDYLEIRPEREAQIRQYAKEGRLRIGPWYTMPDENIVSAESLVRNLEEGLRVARDYGNESHVGFICDIFGHTSQMPQILHLFGIDNAFIFRGVNEDRHKGVFLWRGADGSEVITTKFGPTEGYFDYASKIRRAFKPDELFDLDTAAKETVDYVAMHRDRMDLNVVLLFDGGDHMEIEPQTSELLDRVRKIAPHLDLQHTGLEEYVEELRKERAGITRVFDGELRDPGRIVGDGGYVIPGVLSSRVKLKQTNRYLETELCHWVEPFSHMTASLTSAEYPHSYIRRSWRYLLENHAHDSICGCSPDQIHKDMEFRFDQARLINDRVLADKLGTIAGRVDLPEQEGDDFGLVVFNPTQHDIDGPVDLELWFDEKIDKLYAEFFHYEWKVGFRLFDADDLEIPYDFVSYAPQRRRFWRSHRRIPMGQECVVVNVTAPLKIPALGYTTITCKPVKAPTRHPIGGVVRGDRVLENDLLRVEVNDNGTLKLLDKASGQTYDRLMFFEERADIGDGWFHGVAANDHVYSSTAAHADVAVIYDGGQKGVLRVTNRMRTPKQFDFDKKMRRSEEFVELVIRTDITLRRDADHLELRTEIENNVRDHRVRVMFETGAQTDSYLADAAYDVVKRQIGLPEDNHTYKELAVETTPQQSFTAVHDGQRGLAVIAPGTPETAVRDEPQRTLALTLVRGFRRTIFTDGEEGGQSLGRHVFNYRLKPLAGAPDLQRLYAIAQLTDAGVRQRQVLKRDQAPRDDRSLQRTYQMMKFEKNQLVMSAMRRQPDGEALELRVFNPTDQAVTDAAIFDRAISKAEVIDFNGQVVGSAQASGERVALEVGPRKILTVRLALQQ